MVTVGDLDIRSGGIVAVDTASLRAAADRLEQAAVGLDGVGDVFRRAAAGMEVLPRAGALGALPRCHNARARAAQLAERSRAIGGSLLELAAMFETVELRAEREAAEAAGDAAAVARIDERLAQLKHEYPGSDTRAWWEGFTRDAGWAASLVGQAGMAGSLLGPGAGLAGVALLWGFTAGLRGMGNGTLERGSRLHGPARPVVLRGAPVVAAGTAPDTLAAVAGRVPTGAVSQIRVERYVMPDGTRQYAVYIPGTTAGDEDEPFDMGSNLELYTGEQSASYGAVLEALREAGAEPGDTLHAVGYSQGAMLASRLAVEGGYDTQTLVTFGSPVDAQVPDATLSVEVRHRDDPVSALAGGGFDAGAGTPGSFVAERTADPAAGANDLDPLVAHHLPAYEQTAAMLDASSDPRMNAVRDRLALLGGATSVTVSEYSVGRADPAPTAPVCR